MTPSSIPGRFTVECAWCRQPFRTDSPLALYCSASHRQLAYQLRRALAGKFTPAAPAEIPGQQALSLTEKEEGQDA